MCTDTEGGKEEGEEGEEASFEKAGKEEEEGAILGVCGDGRWLTPWE